MWLQALAGENPTIVLLRRSISTNNENFSGWLPAFAGKSPSVFIW